TLTPPATPAIYTLSLHDALPISDPIGGEYQHVPRPQGNNRSVQRWQLAVAHHPGTRQQLLARGEHAGSSTADDAAHVADSQPARSEEHTSELQSPYDLVCRLLLE